ncbi:hypothetical protein DENSPDRAFT_883561 [Dentipellis sp. KUC8613]|nr:hypothetical protein DENSPDRAFT_883561 [Dentipellis sp. KUC8613]
MSSPELSPPTLPAMGSLRAAIRSIDSLSSPDLSPSSSASTSSLPSLAESPSTASSSSLASLQSLAGTPIRTNEHLAVLLPKHLWKPDSHASHCETFVCHKRFTLFERRHHCRKCGGLFCATCTTRTTPLLDTTALSFLHPPRGTPLSLYASPISPLTPERVCDACFDQIHASPTPRSRTTRLPAFVEAAQAARAMPKPILKQPRSRGSSRSSSVSVITPPDGQSPATRRRVRTLAPCPPPAPASEDSDVPSPLPAPSELDAYPLRIRSDLCKRTGGGRWEPKKCVLSVPRVPGRKAAFELELEREEAERRRERENPLVRDGDFMYRVPREVCPSSPGGPWVLSTF